MANFVALIVEDDRIQRELLSELLSDEGLEGCRMQHRRCSGNCPGLCWNRTPGIRDRYFAG
jgi:CheY-like chemotaxis protein